MPTFHLSQGDRAISIVQTGDAARVVLTVPEGWKEHKRWLVDVLETMTESERHAFLERYFKLPIKAPRCL